VRNAIALRGMLARAGDRRPARAAAKSTPFV
jgi:hypothetical protein